MNCSFPFKVALAGLCKIKNLIGVNDAFCPSVPHVRATPLLAWHSQQAHQPPNGFDQFPQTDLSPTCWLSKDGDMGPWQQSPSTSPSCNTCPQPRTLKAAFYYQIVSHHSWFWLRFKKWSFWKQIAEITRSVRYCENFFAIQLDPIDIRFLVVVNLGYLSFRQTCNGSSGQSTTRSTFKPEAYTQSISKNNRMDLKST